MEVTQEDIQKIEAEFEYTLKYMKSAKRKLSNVKWVKSAPKEALLAEGEKLRLATLKATTFMIALSRVSLASQLSAVTILMETLSGDEDQVKET